MKLRSRIQQLTREKAAREERNITVLDLMRETGLGRSTVYSWWHDKLTRRDDEIILVWVEYFGLDSLDQLFEIVEESTALRAAC